MNTDPIHIGTSGWHYSHWKGPFYPEDMPAREFLTYYAQRFNTTEINNTFYQLPAEKTLAEWRDTAPEGFTFAVKASRYITHMKKLKDPEKSAGNFLNRIYVLGNRLGPILFQLPPKWKANAERLDGFLNGLPKDYRYAFEFRDESWFSDEIESVLARYNAGFCIYHLAGEGSPLKVTGDPVYVRLHGPGGAYEGSYDDARLAGWAQTLKSWAADGRQVYCYFDNDEAGYAAQDAARLLEMIKQ